MAISAYTGPPGSGKSYAMVSQVILPAIEQGRRVVTNVAGVNPERIYAYVSENMKPKGELGRIIQFDGKDALKPGFFPTEEIPDTTTFIKAGDLLVFDEWKMVFPTRGARAQTDVEGFLRWHRHLVDENGRASDVVIGTQLISDVHRDYRGLIERSFKFKNLKTVGLAKSYVADCYEGHLQSKGESYRTINGRYRKPIFDLYSSYDADDGEEGATDNRASVFSKSIYVGAAVGVTVLAAALYYLYGFFFPQGSEQPPLQAGEPAGIAAAPPTASQPLASGSWRIMGHLQSSEGVKVIVQDAGGTMRVLHSRNFNFDGGRPVSGEVDGIRIAAEDRLPLDNDERSDGRRPYEPNQADLVAAIAGNPADPCIGATC